MAKKAAPAKKQFRVTLDDNSPRPISTVVIAETEADAVEKFKEWAGITRSIHPFLAVDIATEAAEEEVGGESLPADPAPASSGLASESI